MEGYLNTGEMSGLLYKAKQRLAIALKGSKKNWESRRKKKRSPWEGKICLGRRGRRRENESQGRED